MHQQKDTDWLGDESMSIYALPLTTSPCLAPGIKCNYFILLGHVPIMTCNFKHLLSFVWLLIVKTDKSLLLLQRQGNSDTCYNMYEPWKHLAKWNKPITHTHTKTKFCLIPLLWGLRGDKLMETKSSHGGCQGMGGGEGKGAFFL